MAYNDDLYQSYANNIAALNKVKNYLSNAKEFIYMIYPHNQSLEDLDKEFALYNSKTKYYRRVADWYMIDAFGINNRDMYNIIRSHIINTDPGYEPNPERYMSTMGDTSDTVNESATDNLVYIASQDKSNVEDCLMAKDELEMENLQRWYNEEWYPNTAIIIFPFEFMRRQEENVIHNIGEGRSDGEYIEDLILDIWNDFNLMTHKHRKDSDNLLIEKLGFSNMQYYDFIMPRIRGCNSDNPDHNVTTHYKPMNKIKFYYDKLMETMDFNSTDLAESLVDLSTIPDTTDGIIAGDIISDVIDKYDGLTNNVDTINLDVGDLPMYTPDELNQIGILNDNKEDNCYGAIGENYLMAKEWFQEYSDYYYSGITSPRYFELNQQRLDILESFDMTKLNDNDRQTMLNLGWNPYVEFSYPNRAKADTRIRSILKEYMNRSDFIDVSGFEVSQDAITEATDKKLNPIYVVLEEGKAPIFSDLIRTVTDGIYSHAMIAFDNTLTKLYTYGVVGTGRVSGSFAVENIRKKPKNAKIKIFTVFVNDEAYKNIKNNIEWFVEHQKETLYSWRKLFTYLFHIPVNSDSPNMICSEFVDKMLKLAGVDISNKRSSMVAPNDIDRMAKKNRKIYTIYSDLISKFKPEAIKRKVDKLLSKAKLYNEATIYESNIFPTITKANIRNIDMLRMLSENVTDSRLIPVFDKIINPMMEAREIPIKIDKNGDIIISRLSPTDFEAAYAKSHKLLMEYAKAGNYDGIKHELAYMWYLNIVIEKKMYMYKIPVTRKKELEKARAKVLNDFKTYMAVIQKEDRHFDFRKYFEASEYSDAAYKISQSTIKGAIGIVKSII